MYIRVLEELATKYKDDIYNFCYHLTQNKCMADDLFQDTFEKAIQLRHRLVCSDKEESEEAKKKMERKNRNFLMGIAANLWKNNCKVQKRRQELVPIVSYENESCLEVRSDKLVEEEVEKNLLRKELCWNITQLPQKQRIVLIMYYTAEMSTTEISKELHIPKGTVISRLHQAKRTLKTRLEEKGYE